MRHHPILGRLATIMLLVLLCPLALVQILPTIAYAAAATTTFSNAANIHIGPYGTDPGNACPCAAGPSDPYPSTITVSGLSGPVSKVTIKLKGISHSATEHIDVMLVGPVGGGQNLVVLSDINSTTPFNNVDLTFDDDAAAQLVHNTAISSGTYQPTNRVSTAGTDVGGTDNFTSPAPTPSSHTTFVSAFI